VEADPVGETLFSARNIDGGRSLETNYSWVSNIFVRIPCNSHIQVQLAP